MSTIETIINYVDPGAPIGAHNDLERQKSTLKLVPYKVALHDARAAQLSLDRTGFVLAKRPTRVTDFYDPKQVAEIFEPEVADFVQELTGADKVIVFGTVIRNDNPRAGDGLRNRSITRMSITTCRPAARSPKASLRRGLGKIPKRPGDPDQCLAAIVRWKARRSR